MKKFIWVLALALKFNKNVNALAQKKVCSLSIKWLQVKLFFLHSQ